MAGILRFFKRRKRLAEKARAYGPALGNVKVYCMFIGYPRSGHSLIGSLLDAHPNVVIAHEADTLRMVERRMPRNDIFVTLLENSRAYAEAGRAETGYSYEVPGQWQGRFSKLLVIGDKKGGQSALALLRNPHLLDELQRMLEAIALKIIHVIRNPFDNIATICTRGRSFDSAFDLYFSQCDSVARIRQRLGPNIVLDLRQETVIEAPKEALVKLWRFLNVEPLDDCLDACASIVYESPNKSRCKIDWTSEMIERVHERMADYDYLAGYTYET